MNTTWQDSLTALGYAIDDAGSATINSASSGNSADSGNASLVPLTQHRIIRIAGPETQKFLQGQLSCDIAAVDRIGSHLGSHCNPKGHMISLYRVMKQNAESFWLRTDAGNADKALATIKKYILFSKAEAELSDELVGFGLFGAGAAELAAKIGTSVPAEVDAVVSDRERLLVRVPGDRFECWLPADQASELIEQLKESVTLASTDDWILEEIRAGLPELRAETSEAFIPQMTNIQVFEGVSFTKGCYTGQEVVTRLQHRGILKKPMYRARVTGSTRPQPGEVLHTAEKEGVGQVVIAAPCGNDQYELLAVIVKEQAENATIHLGTADGPALELLELPYSLDPKMFESKR